MPVPTPFHPRTAALCTSLRWKEWAGCHAVCSYDTCHAREYFAFRHAAGLLDASPLFKYRVEGREAAAMLARLVVKDVTRLKPGRVTYLCWCDEQGKVLDDGTLTCLDEGRYRLTSADPSLAWLLRNSRGFEALVSDESERLGTLALQGPTSREVLGDACQEDVSGLRFFRHRSARVAGRPVEITRTGYTGDLGYEVWVEAADALAVWDAITAAGRPHGLEPAGLDALDVTRIEAGFVLMGVDYRSARRCLLPSQTSTPDEIGLAWAVDLERAPFLGQEAIRRERSRQPRWSLVGLEIDWAELEALWDSFGLNVELPAAAWRTPVPVYRELGQIGYATSGAWSPTLKKNLALATVRADCAAPGTRLSIETTVEFERRRVGAVVRERPFFDPERKRSTPTAAALAEGR
jgi:aminomethyltransferase